MNDAAKDVVDTRSPWLTPSATPPSSRTLTSTRASSSTAPPPFKRPRLASSHPPPSDTNTNDLDAQRQASTKRLLDVWSQLEQRYSRAIDEDDIVDLVSLKVVKDRGQLRSMSKRWDFGFAGDEEERANTDAELESPITSEEEFEGEEGEESADELDVIPRSVPDDTGQPGPETLQETWNAREALDPDNPSDAEDLDRFLEAERRRREAGGGAGEDEDEDDATTELENTPFSSLEDSESTSIPASYSSDADWSTAPPTSDVETDRPSSPIHPPKASGSKSNRATMSSPKTATRTSSRPRRPPSLSSDSDDDIPLAESSSSSKQYKSSAKPTTTTPKPKGRVPHMDFSQISKSTSKRKPQTRPLLPPPPPPLLTPSVNRASSTTLVDKPEPIKNRTIMEVVLPPPRYQSHTPAPSTKGKGKALPLPDESDSDDPLSQPSWRGPTKSMEDSSPITLPVGRKRKRKLSSSPEIEIIEITDSDSDSALPPPPPPRNRSRSRARDVPAAHNARPRSRSRSRPRPSMDDDLRSNVPSSSSSNFPPSTYDEDAGSSLPPSYPPIPELPPIHDPRMQYMISQVVQHLTALYPPPPPPPSDHAPYTPRHLEREPSVSHYHTPHSRPFPYTQNSDYSVGSLPPSSPEPESSSPMKPISSSPPSQPPMKKRASSLVRRSRSRGRRVSFHFDEDERARLESPELDSEPVAFTSVSKTKKKAVPKPRLKKKVAEQLSSEKGDEEETRGRSSSRGRTPGPPDSSPTKRAVANKQKRKGSKIG